MKAFCSIEITKASFKKSSYVVIDFHQSSNSTTDTKSLDGTLNLNFAVWGLLSLEKYIAEIGEKSLSCGLL